LADQLEQYLNPTLKGTVFEDLTSTDMQSDSPHREECWLEQGVFKHLKELFVRTGRHFTRAAQPLQRPGNTTNFGTAGSSSVHHPSPSGTAMWSLVAGFQAIGMQDKLSKYSLLLSDRHPKCSLSCRDLRNSLQTRPNEIHNINSLWLVATSITVNLRMKLR
jgi:hypothetical protein